MPATAPHFVPTAVNMTLKCLVRNKHPWAFLQQVQQPSRANPQKSIRLSDLKNRPHSCFFLAHLWCAESFDIFPTAWVVEWRRLSLSRLAGATATGAPCSQSGHEKMDRAGPKLLDWSTKSVLSLNQLSIWPTLCLSPKNIVFLYTGMSYQFQDRRKLKNNF